VQASRTKEAEVPEGLGLLVSEAQASIADLLVDVPEEDMQKARQVAAVVSGKDASTPNEGSLQASGSSKAAQRLEAVL
jgi:hypothetical protein